MFVTLIFGSKFYSWQTIKVHSGIENKKIILEEQILNKNEINIKLTHVLQTDKVRIQNQSFKIIRRKIKSKGVVSTRTLGLLWFLSDLILSFRQAVKWLIIQRMHSPTSLPISDVQQAWDLFD